uniref:Uncharacterized protein n=1 Tax=Anguilla anguilla TaxID=7936 RepID=A0A0E9QZI0_ANGAN
MSIASSKCLLQKCSKINECLFQDACVISRFLVHQKMKVGWYKNMAAFHLSDLATLSIR